MEFLVFASGLVFRLPAWGHPRLAAARSSVNLRPEMRIRYATRRKITAAEFVDLLRRSTLAERRPVDNARAIEAMINHADLLCTAWDGSRLVGVARSVTDFAYCCYLSDLAVDLAYQKQGIGRGLIRLTQSRLGPKAKVILLAAPKAEAYQQRRRRSGYRKTACRSAVRSVLPRAVTGNSRSTAQRLGVFQAAVSARKSVFSASKVRSVATAAPSTGSDSGPRSTQTSRTPGMRRTGTERPPRPDSPGGRQLSRPCRGGRKAQPRRGRRGRPDPAVSSIPAGRRDAGCPA